jgi:cob(I)alamin adenosyltransferase
MHANIHCAKGYNRRAERGTLQLKTNEDETLRQIRLQA